MIVTDLKQAKKYKDDIHIYIDDEYNSTVFIDYILKFGIKIGFEISESILEEIKFLSAQRKLFNLSVLYIARRLRSENEIREYIKKKIFSYKYDKEKINVDEIIKKLYEYHYLDNVEFAKLWASERVKRGIGPFRLQMELHAKGIDLETIKMVLKDLSVDEKSNAEKKLAEKYLRNKTFKSEAEKQWKLKQYLRSRGF